MAYLLQHLLTEAAARRPDRPAVAAGGRSLTYSELDRLSNQVARALLARGVAPGDRVGVFAPKSAASVVGIFGALKAGTRYVPLDPGAPAGRLSGIRGPRAPAPDVAALRKVRVVHAAFISVN
jgi:non-ribosomal peptide synthetase component F